MNTLHVVSVSMVGCKRLLHKGTKELHYTPHSKLQIIAGANGYGKSTLLHHLSPLPPSPKEFIKGGYKDSKFELGGSQYHLICDFRKGSHYSFLKDGKELNDARTQSVQRLLVEQYFGYTNDLHLLLTGKIKLTQLPVQKRKEWLVKLCQTDVTYAMGVYNRLSQSHRKSVATKEHLSKKLIDVSSKLMSQEDFDELNREIKKIASEDQQIIDAIGFVEWTDGHLNTFKRLEKDTVELSLLIAQKMPETRRYVDPSKLDEELYSATQKTSDIEDLLSQKYHEYNTLNDAVSHMQSLGGQTIAELEQQLSETEAKLPDIENNSLKDIVVDVDAAIVDVTSIKDRLNHVLMTLPKNPDMQLYNRQTIGDRKMQVQDLQMLIHRDTNSLDRATARIKELKEHDELECPSCEHKWIPGYSEKELENLTLLVDKYRKEIEDRTARLDSLNEWLGYSNEWVVAYKQYRELADSFPRLSTLFDTFVEGLRVFNDPASLVGSADKFLHDLIDVQTHRRLTSLISSIETALSQKRLLESSNVSALTTRLNEIISTIEKLQAERAAAKEMEDFISSYKSQVDEVSALMDVVKNNVRDYCSMMVTKSKYESNLELRRILSENADKVKDLNGKLTDAVSSKGIVEHIQTSIDELTDEIEAYEILLAELSPKEGVIADALGGFGNALAEQMNKIIKKIWLTPLRIRPCALKDGDLDYQFPLSSSEDVDDISMGSDGEMELIDFAFVMVARSYLGLQKLPLFLDEVGKSFHDDHKNSLYQYIKGLIDGALVNQVFIISHSPTAHSTLVHADLNIISPIGQSYAANANKCLTIS